MELTGQNIKINPFITLLPYVLPGGLVSENISSLEIAYSRAPGTFTDKKIMLKIFTIIKKLTCECHRHFLTFSGYLGLPPTAITIFSAVIIVWESKNDV